jgi:hypothetical protein
MGSEYGFGRVEQHIEKTNRISIDRSIYLIYLIGIYYYRSICAFARI